MTSQERIKEAKETWVRECVQGDLGLWFIAGSIREILPEAPEDEIRRETLAALEPLLKVRTLRAADALPQGRFDAWEGSAAEHLARIDSEWRRLGRAPDIGEITWFIGPS